MSRLSGLVFHQHEALGDIGTWQNGIICIVCMKRLKWIHMKKFWLKKCEKSVKSWCQKRKIKGDLLVNDRECFALSHFFFLPIKTRFLYLFVSSTVKVANMANYIKHDLDNLNFSSTTIVIPLFSWTTSVVHIFKIMSRITVVHHKNLRKNSDIHIHTSRKSLSRDF